MSHDLLSTYIDDVVNRLPDHEQDAIRDALQKTFETMLAVDAPVDEIKAAIEHMGPPFKVASDNLSSTHVLLSPIMIEPYRLALKTVTVIFVVAALAIAIFEGFMGASLTSLTNALFGVLAKAVTHVVVSFILAFGLVTLTYLMIETLERWYAKARWNASVYETEEHLSSRYGRDLLFAKITATIALGGGIIILILAKARTLGWYDNGKMVARLLNPDIISPYVPLLMIAFFLYILSDAFRIAQDVRSKRLVVFDILATSVSLTFLLMFLHQENIINPQFLAYVANSRSVHISVVINRYTRVIWFVTLMAITLSIWHLWHPLKMVYAHFNKKRQT